MIRKYKGTQKYIKSSKVPAGNERKYMTEYQYYLVCVTLDEVSIKDIQIVESDSDSTVMVKRLDKIFDEKKSNTKVFRLNRSKRKVSVSIDEEGKFIWNVSRWNRKPKKAPTRVACSFYEIEHTDENNCHTKSVHEYWTWIEKHDLEPLYKCWSQENAKAIFDAIQNSKFG